MILSRLKVVVLLVLFAATSATSVGVVVSKADESARHLRTENIEQHLWYKGATSSALTLKETEKVSKLPTVQHGSYNEDGYKYGKSSSKASAGGKGSYKKGKGGKGSSKKSSKSSKSKKSSSSKKSKGGDGSVQHLRIPDVAMTFLYLEEAPSPSDLALLAQATVEWFEMNVRDQLPNFTFLLDTDFSINIAEVDVEGEVLILYDYIEYTIFITDAATEDALTAAEINCIMAASITVEFILDVVRQIEAFQTINEAYYDSLDSAFDPIQCFSPPSLSPSPFPSPTFLPTVSIDTQTPTSTPSPTPTGRLDPFVPPFVPIPDDSDVIRVKAFSLFYFSTQDPLVEPTPEQFQEQFDLTVAYWESYIFDAFQGTGFEESFYGAAALLRNAGLDDTSNGLFNIRMEYDYIDIFFAPGTIEAISELAGVPLDADFFFGVLQESLTAAFIQNYVRSVADSAFVDVTELSMQQDFSSKTPSISPSVATPTLLPSLRPTFSAAPSPGTGCEFVPPDTIPNDAEVLRIPGASLSYVSTQSPLIEPTMEQFDQVVEGTLAFWECSMFLDLQTLVPVVVDFPIEDGFLGINAAIETTVLNAGLPGDKFNILVQLEYIDLFFLAGTIGGISEPFDPESVFELLRNAITADYLLDVVRTIENSAFASVTEVVIPKMKFQI